MPPTHEVLNQAPPLRDVNVFRADRGLVDAVCRFDAAWATESLSALGQLAGSEQWQHLGELANTNPPKLHTHDRFGARLDEVEFHPAWHQLMAKATEHGLHASPWRDPRPGAHVARAAGFLVWSQVEAGHLCPISMTFAAVPVIRHQPELARAWEPRLLSSQYEPELTADKPSALCGMAMTEKQGGSDVRANTTRAEPLGDGAYAITGHKWFCSAPQCDAFLVLAQTSNGLGCFLMPRLCPDGAKNRFFIQRLKDKLGNRSNASSEVEFDGAYACLIGEEGRGVPVIAEMVNSTRLDCILGTAALMRHAYVTAAHHATHRAAFGKLLIDQPLMQNVLADLAIESEAATQLALRLAAAADRADDDPREGHLKRLGTALGKYWVCKRGPAVVAEALECLGGNGYVEESGLPRMYREAPLNSIWEGAGNVQALDILRILRRTPEALDAVFDEVFEAGGGNRALETEAAKLRAAAGELAEGQARHLAERFALLLQASLLVRFASNEVADAFCATRLQRSGGIALGTLPEAIDARTIVHQTKVP
jgi:putative acyl-CoA dehydrogenase